MSDCHNCKGLARAVERGEETHATCGTCGKLHRAPRSAEAWEPRTRRDMPALARLSDLHAIDLDPASKLRGSDEPEDIGATVRAERSVLNGRNAEKRLAAMRARGPEGVRYARAVWLAYGARGEEVNKRESLAALIARECLVWEPGDWSVALAERRRITDRAAARKVQVPDALRLVATILGNAILGCASTAYDLDVWEDWRPRAEAEAAVEEPARLRRVREWRERFDARPRESNGT